MAQYEYHVSDILNLERAQLYMNNMAQQGWRVADTIFWSKLPSGMVITFEREKPAQD